MLKSIYLEVPFSVYIVLKMLTLRGELHYTLNTPCMFQTSQNVLTLTKQYMNTLV